MKTTNQAFLALLVLPFLAVSVFAQSAKPQRLPMPDSIPAAQDTPYPGVIQLDVDATDVDRHIFRVRESIPVAGGTTVTLMYPEWLPANHADYGRVENLGGLKVFAAGERIAWTRDTVNVFAFHIDVPESVNQLDLEFQFLSAVTTGQGRVVMTDEMLNLQWRSVVLYPAGYFDSQVTIRSSVRVPEGWQLATALEVEDVNNGITNFKPVSLETLIDSPLFAGRYFKRLDLNPDGDYPVHLNIVADEERMLEVTPEQLEMHREMVQQADKLFQSHHFDHYDFLFALTDRMGGIGLEHHQSSENSEDPGFFTSWDSHVRGRDLLPHEYTHSWNGKFRRPSDLWTPNASVPMRGSLLWLYEGQTQYWGKVLTARSGMHTLEEALGSLAYDAAYYDVRIGREWRNLQDNTNDPVSMLRRSLSWSSWQRSEDYYSEGLLIWFDVDTLIRELSRGRRSLDDFAALFFGINDGSFVPVTYEFDDIIASLNEVEEYDWATFLRERLDGHGPGAPLDGIERGGYQLVYKEEPNEYFAGYGAYYEYLDLTYSVGMNVYYTGLIGHVLWEGPAFKKGITLGNQIVAVNGTAFDPERLERAISEAKENKTAIDLLILDGVHYRTVSLDYFDGLRYPHLERAGKGKSSLEEIFAPKK